jgi:HSP20 family protein
MVDMPHNERSESMLRMDPFEEMDRMLNTFGGRWRGGMMPLDAFEKDGIYTLRFDVPGVDPDNVDLTVEGNMLTVTADRPVEETEGATWLLRERPSGTHSREVRLGDRLDTSNVKAGYDNGVLTVEIPMRAEARPHKVSITPGNTEKLTAGV